jgi:curli biogenesis system outer membrane secretion channel CsgG
VTPDTATFDLGQDIGVLSHPPKQGVTPTCKELTANSFPKIPVTVSKAVLVSSVLIVHLLLSSSYAEDKPAASPASPKIGTVQRRVLIFDFENQTGKIEFDYLSGSISDALADSIKKTGKFRLMLREDARVNAIADDATAPAKATPAEVNSGSGH